MLHVKGPATGSELDIDGGATAKDLLDHLDIKKHHQGSVSVFINDVKVHHTHALHENDRVFLSVPMSGG